MRPWAWALLCLFLAICALWATGFRHWSLVPFAMVILLAVFAAAHTADRPRKPRAPRPARWVQDIPEDHPDGLTGAETRYLSRIQPNDQGTS